MDDLLPLVYQELRRIAARQLGGEPAGQTLCTTALVQEAWMERAKLHRIQWQNRCAADSSPSAHSMSG
jgi:RNA polymerase sigma-70 factor, ECF subfamily